MDFTPPPPHRASGLSGASRRRLAAVVLVVALAASLALAAQPASSQSDERRISSLALASPEPGVITAMWLEPADAPARYRLRYAPEGGNWRKKTVDAAEARLVGLESGTHYRVQVRGRYSSRDWGPWSAEVAIQAQTDTAPETPETPETPDSPDGTGGPETAAATADDRQPVGATRADAVPLRVGRSVSGDLPQGAQRWFRFDAVDGYKYRFVLDYRGQAATLEDWSLRSSNGQLVVRDGASGDGDPAAGSILWEADRTGVMTLRLGGGPGRYRVQIVGHGPALWWNTTPPKWAASDTPPDTTSEALVLVNGTNGGYEYRPNPAGRWTDSIDFAGDADFVGVWLQAGVRYQFNMIGRNSGWDRSDGLTLDDPAIRGLHDPAGNHIAGTDPRPGDRYYTPGASSTLVHTPAATGLHWIRAQGAQHRSLGTYAIQVIDMDRPNGPTQPPGISERPGDDFDFVVRGDNMLRSFGQIVVGHPATGELGIEDDDSFLFTPRIGQAYRITVTGRTDTNPGGTLKNPGVFVNAKQRSGWPSDVLGLDDNANTPDGRATVQLIITDGDTAVVPDGTTRLDISDQALYDRDDLQLYITVNSAINVNRGGIPYDPLDKGTYTVIVEPVN